MKQFGSALSRVFVLIIISITLGCAANPTGTAAKSVKNKNINAKKTTKVNQATVAGVDSKLKKAVTSKVANSSVAKSPQVAGSKSAVAAKSVSIRKPLVRKAVAPKRKPVVARGTTAVAKSRASRKMASAKRPVVAKRVKTRSAPARVVAVKKKAPSRARAKPVARTAVRVAKVKYGTGSKVPEQVRIPHIKMATAASKVKIPLPKPSKRIVQARKPAQLRTVKRVAPRATIKVATRAKQAIRTRSLGKVASRAPVRVATRAKQPVKSRSLGKVATKARARVVTRAKQPVRTRTVAKRVKPRAPVRVASRARQSVRARARQPVRARARQPVRARARQPVRTRARQPVRTRARLAKIPVYVSNTSTPRRSAAVARAQAKAKERSAALAKRRAIQLARKNANRRGSAKRRTIARISPDVKFGYSLSKAAVERTRHRVFYDGKYIKIGYPWGDVPKSIGVCTDVVIRAYRKLGIDLQQEVHKDISRDFYAYPNLKKWGLRAPDPNIDHRRVYNLQAFFKRHKAELPRSRNPKDYKPGDLVTWMVGPQFPHIGVVVNIPSKADPNRLMISHNIGRGPEIEDILFKFPMTGHYRYTPKNRKINPAQWLAKTPPPPSVRLAEKQQNDLYSQLLIASKALATPPKNVVNKKAQPNTTVSLAAINKALLGVAGVSEDDIRRLLQ